MNPAVGNVTRGALDTGSVLATADRALLGRGTGRLAATEQAHFQQYRVPPPGHPAEKLSQRGIAGVSGID